ncbi:MAG: PQQ-binding-like beta-propeller repeat protein [Bacteroidetes bacterium]|nr:PQQ-binding-like beta-propeller repeat protein [Bacteroidota bacterium]
MLLLTGCRGLQVSPPLSAAQETWVTEGGSPLRQHTAPATLSVPLEEAWTYNAGAGFGAPSPLVVDDLVLAATRKGEIHAIDLESGERKGFETFGETVEGTPVIGNGVMYVPVGWGKRTLYAYDLLRGRSTWKARGAAVEAGLLLLDDGLIAVDVDGLVRKYGLSSGDVLWEYELGGKTLVRATPVLVNGSVVVADTDGRIAAFNPADGTVRWTRELPAPVFTSFAGDEDQVYVSTTRGQFFALSAESGVTRWRMALPDTTVRLSAPAVSEDLVVVGGTDGVLRALRPSDGQEVWSYQDEDAITAPPLITQHHVFVGTMGKRLVAVGRDDGTAQWTHELRGRMKSPMVLHRGRLIVQAEPRHVICFTAQEESPYASTP